MSETNGPNDDLLREWNALLDGELPPHRQADLRAAPGAGAFLDSQERFNAALHASMNQDRPDVMPMEVRQKIRRAIRDTVMEAQGLTVTPQGGRASMRALRGGVTPSRRPVWQYAAGLAAMLILGLFVGFIAAGGFGPSVDPGFSPEEVTLPGQDTARSRMAYLANMGTNMVLDLGTRRPDELSEYARTIGFPHPIPAYPKHGTCTEMAPVNIHTGVTPDGAKYEAITFCGGPVQETPDGTPTPGKRLHRIVMYVVDGDLRPACKQRKGENVWLSCEPGRAMVAKYDSVSNRSTLVFIPGCTGEDRAHELAQPLLVSAQ